MLMSDNPPSSHSRPVREFDDESPWVSPHPALEPSMLASVTTDQSPAKRRDLWNAFQLFWVDLLFCQGT